tara:strand:- start:1726 stop:2286 length:561 start_codon:yes stop_codon:yes gene_type:complete
MSSSIGPNTTLVTWNNVSSITNSNCTIVMDETGNLGPDGGFQIKFYNPTGGCGSVAGRVTLLLNDNDFVWNYISCEFELMGTGSCWGFNDGTYSDLANLMTYSGGSDFISEVRAVNSWENPTYQSHNRVSACDNDANNFFRFSGVKRFIMKRRRNNLSSLAGISHGRSCNSTGVGSYTIIKNIRIW